MNAVDRIVTAFARKTPMTEEQTRAVREEVGKFVVELLARKFKSPEGRAG